MRPMKRKIKLRAIKLSNTDHCGKKKKSHHAGQFENIIGKSKK